MYFGFDNVSINYGDREIIRNLSAEFPKGAITTILGKNGCGKSTLLKTVPQAVTPVSGRVLFNDRDIRKYKPKELAKKIAYLSQIHIFPPDIDVKTLVSYGRYPYRKFGSSLMQADWDIIEESIRLTGMEDKMHSKISQLSGGERQRAWIAMTICQKPEILILDEPTTHLDVGYQIEVLDLVKYLKEQLNITIIMVLHDINFAARYSDYIFMLDRKNIQYRGKPEEILTRETIREIFNVNATIEHDSRNDCPYYILDRI